MSGSSTKVLRVEKAEIESLKPGKAVYVKQGNLFFQTSKKDALGSIRGVSNSRNNIIMTLIFSFRSSPGGEENHVTSEYVTMFCKQQ